MMYHEITTIEYRAIALFVLIMLSAWLINKWGK